MRRYWFLLILIPYLSIAQDSTDNWIAHHDSTDGWFGDVAEDLYGNIIVSGGFTNSHFRIFDGSNWTLYSPASLGVNFSFYGDIAVDTNNKIWFAPGNNHGISSWDGTNITNYVVSNSGIISNSNFGVGVDGNNTIWTTSLQSFDGTVWDTLDANGCTSGGQRNIHISSSDVVWISGVYEIIIDPPGGIIQPCVYSIANNVLTNYHIDNGNNLPLLDGGEHLIGELCDGTTFIAGKTANGIEMKKYNGTNWVNWETYNGSDVGTGYYSMFVSPNDEIFLAGVKDNNTSQIVRYCNGTWTTYDLPQSSGFPDGIFGILLDGSGTLWIVGSNGIFSVVYSSINCMPCGPNAISNINTNSNVAEVYYNNGELKIRKTESEIGQYKINVYNSIGQLIFSSQYLNEYVRIGNISTGVYFVELIDINHQSQMFKIFAN